MESGKKKRGLLVKTLERCMFVNQRRFSEDERVPTIRKSKSWPVARENGKRKKKQVAPLGYFSVYVGKEEQRFVVKIEHANHPLFRALLEEAETEYGYCSQSPLRLPCDVDVFYRVLMQMEEEERGEDEEEMGQGGCSIGSYQLLSPSRAARRNGF